MPVFVLGEKLALESRVAQRLEHPRIGDAVEGGEALWRFARQDVTHGGVT